ncbi:MULTISPECIES: hypothetical protein [Halobacteriovorax]|uniref:Uncharacterized protein n=1 Tax=Halobacteriovorax vibrionivorans TaxID=2152716 RepID=A0ABY0IDV3_9BACT|nr:MULTISPECIES: hypothetical protein [Halobacteriovorax]AYF45067.1 hypothetical protein BALOs_2068 [Halobacteriovorax sp. BALOs_7]RZF21130.1 hypothetical protein DAY19_14215 [Halobacteriovorax vibrionivorans]TGD46273.1 hypothetical protein EP118_12800 [Halobacteriovorax sp. Y22]
MSYFGNSNKGEKIYRGAYNYYRKDNLYAEETFEVYRRPKFHQIYFEGEMLARVMTGELLKVHVAYTVDKEYTPIKVNIVKSLGEQVSKEIFLFDHSNSELKYQFECGDIVKTESIATSPKFFVTTPLSCCSMLFLWSKKFDSVGKNFYSFFSTNNQWTYSGPIINNNIVVERVAQTSENIKIDGSTVTAVQYKLFEKIESNDPKELKETPEMLNIWLSQHQTIPYIIKDNKGTNITIKYLNNLDTI